MPKTRNLFWDKKFERTVETDRRNCCLLSEQGWEVLVVWECQVGCGIETKLRDFLGPPSMSHSDDQRD